MAPARIPEECACARKQRKHRGAEVRYPARHEIGCGSYREIRRVELSTGKPVADVIERHENHHQSPEEIDGPETVGPRRSGFRHGGLLRLRDRVIGIRVIPGHFFAGFHCDGNEWLNREDAANRP